MQTITVERNPVFEPLWETRKRYVVMKGSAGSGKSVDTAQMYIIRLLSQPGRNLLCVRKTDLSNRNSTFAELSKAVRALGLSDAFKITSSPLKITCTNGNEILFGGVNDDGQREKLKSITASSGKLTDVWIEEATEITQADFEIIDDRLRGILPDGLFYQIRLTFNPVSSAHWIKRVFFDRTDPDVITHHSTYLDNCFCDQAYYRRMERRKEIDPDGYRIYGLGEWGEASGLIFTNYEIRDFNDNFDFVRYGQDFGYNHANALLKIGIRDGDIYVAREIYVTETTTDDVIRMASDWDKSIPMICDSAEPDRILMWQRAGFRAQGVHKYPGSVKYAIDWLKQRKIFIHPDCTGTIREIGSWRWKKDKDGNYLDEPTPFEDDAMAALRYACAEWIMRDKVTNEKKQPDPVYNFSFEKPAGQFDHERTVVL